MTMHYKRESILRALAEIQQAVLNSPDWVFSGPRPLPFVPPAIEPNGNPNLTATSEPPNGGDVDPWDSGILGRSEAHARRASPESEAAVDRILGIKRKPRSDKGKPRGKRKTAKFPSPEQRAIYKAAAPTIQKAAKRVAAGMARVARAQNKKIDAIQARVRAKLGRKAK